MPVDTELVYNESTGGEMRYFLPPKQAPAAQEGAAPYAMLHAGTMLLLLRVSQLCSGAGEFPLAAQSVV